MNFISNTGSRARVFVGASVLLLLLNTLYLSLTASPTLFYFANVVLHMALGLALGGMFAIRLTRAWTGLSTWLRLAATVFAIGLAFGVAIMFLGAAGQYRWLLP